MTIKIYGSESSPPCRAVYMCLELLGVNYERVEVSTKDGDHMKPEYLKMNPFHTIPTLTDGGLTLTESRAMLLYLAKAYAKPSLNPLYPNKVTDQAKVDQRLFFDQGHMWNLLYNTVRPVLRGGEKCEDAMKETMDTSLTRLDEFLAPTGFVAGTKSLTIADIAILATYSSLKACGVLPDKSFANIEKWFNSCQTLIPGYSRINGKGAEALADRYKGALAKLEK